MPRYSAWNPERASALVEDHRDRPGALLPLLHALADEFGYIHADAVPMIAEALTLSRADVLGVIGFYRDFPTQPPGRHVIRLCRSEACQSMGAVGLATHAIRRLAIGWDQTTKDGEFTLRPVFCLGNCALSPAVMVDDRLYGRVDPDRFDSIVAGIADRSLDGESAA